MIDTCYPQHSTVLSSRPVSHTILQYSVDYRSWCYCGLIINIQVNCIITNQNVMAEKVFLNRERAIATAEYPSICRADIPSTTRNIPVSEQLLFRIFDQTSKSFPKFNATRRSLLIKFNSPSEEQNPDTYLKECITSLTNYLVDDVPGRDLVGLKIRNTENVENKVVGISLRRRDHLKLDVAWGVLAKVNQSNARFGLSGRLKVHLDHVRMPAGNGRVKKKGRSLDVMSTIKRSIVTVKAALNCFGVCTYRYGWS